MWEKVRDLRPHLGDGPKRERNSREVGGNESDGPGPKTGPVIDQSNESGGGRRTGRLELTDQLPQAPANPFGPMQMPPGGTVVLALSSWMASKPTLNRPEASICVTTHACATPM